jgi:hypothetical protein
MAKSKPAFNQPGDASILGYTDKRQPKVPVVGNTDALKGVKVKTLPLWDLPKPK